MLQIKKLSNKTWKHIDTNDGAFILTKFYAKLEFNEFLIVESYGSKRRKYLISDIEVYDIGGSAETFANFEDLFLRLEALKYTGFYKDGDIDLVWGSIIGTLSDQTDLQNALDLKVDKVTTAGVERAYIINADGSQGTKATSEFKDVLEFTDLASFPVTGESGKIYVALDTNKTYRWGGSAYVQIGGGNKKWENLFFQDAVGSTVKTITADQKNMHQSRFLANASPYGVLGLTFGNGVTEVGGVVNLNYFSDVAVAQIMGDYIGKVNKIVFTYARNVNESSANTNLMIRVMAETKYNTDMQLIAEYNLVSTTIPAYAEHKVEIPVLTHLPLSAFSNIKWCIRSNNATAQQFGIIRLNVIVEEV